MEHQEHSVNHIGSLWELSDLIANGQIRYAAQHIRDVNRTPNSHIWVEWLIRPRLDNDDIDPRSFILSVISMDLMLELDMRVVADAMDWLGRQPVSTRLSINVSARSISEQRFGQFVLTRMRQHSVLPSQVCFEVTEHGAITNLSAATRFSKVLRGLGAQIALDDLGTGSMHLGMFAPLHLVDFVKIDHSWIVNALDSETHLETVKGLIDFGRRLGVQIIAEGVETTAHLELVRKLEVDFYQGYIDGEPHMLGDEPPELEGENSDYSRTA